MGIKKEYIFIKSDMSLVIQLCAPREKLRFFFLGIIRCLTEGNLHNEQPFCISNEIKICVDSFLRENYFSYKIINKLIHFFSTLEEGEYVYFYPYYMQYDEMYDLFKESLRFYNSDCSDDTILNEMEKYIHKIDTAKEILTGLPYELSLFLPTKKVSVGESDKTERHCIYCGGFQGDDRGTTFKEKAHAIPEALGNKKFIQNEECDSCNSFFAENAEEDLSNMLMFNRLTYGIRGKNGYPIFQIGTSKYARYFDWEEEDINKNWGVFEASKKLIKQERIKAPVIVDIGGKKIDNQICISNIKDYCPMHAYKAMVKCVIGLIGNEKLSMFKNTIHWLRYEKVYHKLPEVAIIESKRILEEPELYIFERKEIADYSLPYCYGELRVADQIFVFIIPFCNMDKKKFRKLQEDAIFCAYLKAMYGKYKLCDLSETKNKRLERMFTKKFEYKI